MPIEWKELASKILEDTKAAIGAEWGSYTDEEKALVERCTARAAYVTVTAVGGIVDTVEKAKVDAQMANIGSAAAGSLVKVLWNVVANILGAAASALLK